MKQVLRAWDNNNTKLFHPTESKLLPVTDNVKYYEKNIVLPLTLKIQEKLVDRSLLLTVSW